MRIHLILLGFLVFISCEATSQSELKEIERYNLKIDEPSGITTNGTHLFIVSDQNGTVYKTSFDGKVLSKFKTDLSDLEGVCYVAPANELAVVDEEKRELHLFTLDGIFVSRFKIKGKQEHKNSGLEGVAYNSKKQSFVVANEKKPKQLLHLDHEMKITEKFKLDFLKDISGVCYDEILAVFWVVSDESKQIFKISTEGELLNSFKIDLKKAEGITCFENKLFVVSDATEELVVFEKPD